MEEKQRRGVGRLWGERSTRGRFHRRSQRVTCWNCDEEGHVVRDCPNKFNKNTRRHFTVSTEETNKRIKRSFKDIKDILQQCAIDGNNDEKIKFFRHKKCEIETTPEKLLFKGARDYNRVWKQERWSI